MSDYLMNFSTMDGVTQEQMAEIYARAAAISGQHVEVRQHPMPGTPDKMTGYWSLLNLSGTSKLNDFWAAAGQLYHEVRAGNVAVLRETPFDAVVSMIEGGRR